VRETEKREFAAPRDRGGVEGLTLGDSAGQAAAEPGELIVNRRSGRAGGGEVRDAEARVGVQQLDQFQAGVAGGPDDGDSNSLSVHPVIVGSVTAITG